MIKKEFRFLSKDQKTKIHGVKWLPDTKEYSAILQITHGMQEYIERYEEFARYLTERGFLVVGHDHLGHGASISASTEYGFFTEKKPSHTLVWDMHTLRKHIQNENEGIPYFMLGHSMGSYMLRKYLTLHSKGLSGAVIVGTGSMPDGLMRLGMLICRVLGNVRGWHYRSPMVKAMSYMGPYQQYDLTGADIGNNWLTKDVSLAKQFFTDPRSGFDFTVNGYYGLMEAVYYDNQPKNIARISKELPLFIVSGDKDPVGNMGKGVKKVFEQYKKAGIRHVSMKLYENDRHEILNELDREDVYQDIYQWMHTVMERSIRC